MIGEGAQPNNEERTKVFSNVIFKHPVAVLIQTGKYKITGNVHVRPDDRLRDELNKSERFVAVTDATVYDREDQVVYESKFIAVNISQIIWIVPEDESNSGQGEK